MTTVTASDVNIIDTYTLEDFRQIYSDFYKEAHGFRPRVDTSDWTIEKFKETFKYLDRICQANITSEAEAEVQAIMDFEKQVTKLIGLGAKDRQTAIRWIASGMGLELYEPKEDDEPYMHHEKYSELCYQLCLPYGYFDKS